MLFRWKDAPSAEELAFGGVPLAEEERTKEMAEVRTSTASAFVASTFGTSAFAGVRRNFQELDGQVNSPADGSVESAANQNAHISKRVVGSEAQFPLMGMELGVPGDGPAVAAGEEPTSARVLTASGGVAVKSRANHEPPSRPKQKACKLVLPASSADTGLAAETRNSSSSEEDVSAGVLGRSADLPAPKARTPSEEARRPLGQGRRHAAPANMPATDECLASEQVPFNDSTLGQEPLAQEQSPPGARSPTPLEMLAGRGAAVAAEKVAQPSSRESPRNSAATKILGTEDDTGSKEEEVESMQGTPTGVLCEQVVPPLRYLDRKATRYADPCHRGSYDELVRNRNRIKMATKPELIALDQKYRQLEE
ncbi:hypothetical protein AXG93_4538s1000 [Marchantia polymorpha subsp. ruderalis]|uniref:Uncharacterized protein n=1 Tax=Marchantia polymorpha subsp. ruderalis TaxID=1480154 RepID=A0A176VF49_MARPO|nr:hypothetical protein AXG93_4538s1000 [Marchantia polymorpha subsp. ruderalis]